MKSREDFHYYDLHDPLDHIDTYVSTTNTLRIDLDEKVASNDIARDDQQGALVELMRGIK